MEEVKLPHPIPRLKLMRIMLEISNLTRKYTPICSFRKYTFQCLGPLNFADVSIFCEKLAFILSKKGPLLKAIVWELCYRVFSYVSSFYKARGYYYWKHNFWRLCVRNPVSGLLQIGQKSEKWQWRLDFPTDVIVDFFFFFFFFFDAVLFLLSSLVIGSSFMSVSSLVLVLW